MSQPKLQSYNPYTAAHIAAYPQTTPAEVENAVAQAHHTFLQWKNTTVEVRAQLMHKLATLLQENRAEYARLMATEMGKPFLQGVAEVEKCAWVCTYYAEESATFLAPRTVATDAQKSYVLHEPYGVWLAVMPWNFPFWQVIRCAIPAIMAGNAVVLKHASSVSGCAQALEKLFRAAGAPEGLFTPLFLSSARVAEVIAHPYIKGVSLTGSESAGSAVAASAGRHIKPCVLELGGNNSFIVLADADLEKAVRDAVFGRFQNNGQSCIAAKRFLIDESVYDRFLSSFEAVIATLKIGDPLDEATFIGPLARLDLAVTVHRQVMESVEKGAHIVCGGHYQGAFYTPTLLSECTPGMPVMDEEVFGPVAAVKKISGLEEAIALTRQSRYGLGASIYTASTKSAETTISDLEEGSVFVNAFVKSDPRLPFGGVKASGFGRELSSEGILSFTYPKTVFFG